MVQLVTSSAPRDLRLLLDPVVALAAQRNDLFGDVAGSFAVGSREYTLPRYRFRGSAAGQEQIKLGIFAGLHGDEPAGSEAAVNFLRRLVAEPDVARGYEVVVYPVCNPTGWEAGTRQNHHGLDLNREFWSSSLQPEVKILEAELRAQRFDGIVALHADDTCSGLYGYAHDRLLNESLLRPALAASERVLPRDCRTRIDGFAASEGIIRDCFRGVLSAPPEQHPQPFDIIFETPALHPLALQARAAEVALETILTEYRVFIAQAQYL